MNNAFSVPVSKVPTVLIIFGATGDLTKRKLMGAIHDLWTKGLLPKPFAIVGVSRRALSDVEFQSYVRGTLRERQGIFAHADESFLSMISYVDGVFDDSETFVRLRRHLEETDSKWGLCSNKLFYLAVPPQLYEGICRSLASAGLTIPCGGEVGWTRILIEKPFGSDTASAEVLDRLLGTLFKEEQVFRIDHYLAKETVQNILAFRFANDIFEPIWNARYIESVHLSLYESEPVGERGAFYDSVGALRDVGQNHLLQMLALVAMDRPKDFSAASIREERARILEELITIDQAEFPRRVIRAQYSGYREESGVSPHSQTETYFFIEARLKAERWRGVPFYLESGKVLSESRTTITMTFRESHSENTHGKTSQNVLTFRIQPNEGISLVFWAKRQGFSMELEPKHLSFSYGPPDSTIPDPYEKILHDCMVGDQTLFTSTREVIAAWRFITPILANWQKIPLRQYEKGAAVVSLRAAESHGGV